MNVDKIRNLTDVELAHQQRELSDQLFKMKFQLKMGQTESLKKIRELKKDIARMQTVLRQKELAGGNGVGCERQQSCAAKHQRQRRRRPARRLRRRKSKPWPKQQQPAQQRPPAVARP